VVVGELSPKLHPGEGRGPVEASEVFERSAPLSPPSQLGPGFRRGGELVDWLARHLPDAHRGCIIGADSIIVSAAEKAALYAKTGAIAVDMESHIAARVAERHNLPFAILRTISDTADHALPPAALVGMKPDGGVALGAVLASVARNPAQLPALIRTGRDAGAAFASLRRAVAALPDQP
ncbi:phosphorylase, partial [Sphingomonas sp. HMWF008]